MKKDWIKNQLTNRSKTIPILSFPSVQLMEISVKDLVESSDNQAKGMKLISNICPISASVSFMDLSVEAEAFGAQIRFFDMDVPTVTGRLIKNNKDALDLKVPEVGLKRDGLNIQTIKRAKELIDDKPVIAGVIGPFSLSGRLMDMTEIMVNCYVDPEMVHLTLEKASQYLLNYIIELKKAKADGVLIAEPAAGLLSPQLCEEFSTKYIKKICEVVKDDNFIVIYHNCGNVVPLAKTIIDIDADIYHFGNAINIEDMLKVIPKEKLVMGNIDPLLFKNGSQEIIKAMTLNLLNRCSIYPNFVISSGCDIPPSSKWENINAYFSTIHDFFNK